MDPIEFAAIQNATRATAAEAVALWLADGLAGLANALPDDVRSVFLTRMRANVERQKEEHLAIAIDGQPPEVSDLVAGEFQEAFAKFTDEVLMRLGEQKNG
jgi:hypothetical protein